MAVHVCDIDAKSLAEIGRYIDAGRYGSVDEFLVVALRNQLVLERSQPIKGQVRDQGTTANVRSAHSGYRLDDVPPEITLASTGTPGRGPLFGQFYRYLPLKFV